MFRFFVDFDHVAYFIRNCAVTKLNCNSVLGAELVSEIVFLRTSISAREKAANRCVKW